MAKLVAMERMVLGLDDEQASQAALDWVVERAAAHPVFVDVVSVASSDRHARRLRVVARAAADRIHTAHPESSAHARLPGLGSAVA